MEENNQLKEKNKSILLAHERLTELLKKAANKILGLINDN